MATPVTEARDGGRRRHGLPVASVWRRALFFLGGEQPSDTSVLAVTAHNGGGGGGGGATKRHAAAAASVSAARAAARASTVQLAFAARVAWSLKMFAARICRGAQRWCTKRGRGAEVQLWCSGAGVPWPTSALPLPRVPACMFLKRKAISAYPAAAPMSSTPPRIAPLPGPVVSAALVLAVSRWCSLVLALSGLFLSGIFRSGCRTPRLAPAGSPGVEVSGWEKCSLGENTDLPNFLKGSPFD